MLKTPSPLGLSRVKPPGEVPTSGEKGVRQLYAKIILLTYHPSFTGYYTFSIFATVFKWFLFSEHNIRMRLKFS
jgi:hypothetical protein